MSLGNFHKSLFQSQICWGIHGTHTQSFANVKNVVYVGWTSSLTSGTVFDSSHWPQFVCISPQKNPATAKVCILLHYIKNIQNYCIFFCLLLTLQNFLCHLEKKNHK